MKKSRLFSTRQLVFMALLVAIEVILSSYLSLKVNDTLRISFETVPLALAALWLGPVAGLVVTLVSDILSTALSYGLGSYFPPIVLGPMVFCLLCCLGKNRLFRCDLSRRRDKVGLIATVILAGVVNNFVIGVVTTTWYQMIVIGKEGTFRTLAALNLAGRLTTKPLTIVASALLVCLIYRHPVVDGQRKSP